MKLRLLVLSLALQGAFFVHSYQIGNCISKAQYMRDFYLGCTTQKDTIKNFFSAMNLSEDACINYCVTPASRDAASVYRR